jgi:hypothetical protein
MQPITNLSLFSGIGALELALEKAGILTIGFCEIEDWPFAVLEKHWPNVPKWRNVKCISRSSLEDSLVRIQALPDYMLALQEKNRVLSLNFCDCSKMSDQIMRYLRTPEDSAQMDFGKCSDILPESGMMRNGTLYGLQDLEHPILEKGRSFLPTPSGTSNHHRNHVMGRLDEWGGSPNPFRGTEIGKVRCASFEEWMMGLPMGWTELTPSEMQLFPRLHSQYLRRLQRMKV